MPLLPRNLPAPVRSVYTTALFSVLKGLGQATATSLTTRDFTARMAADLIFRRVVRDTHAELERVAPQLADLIVRKAVRHGFRYAQKRLDARRRARLAPPGTDEVTREALAGRFRQANGALLAGAPQWLLRAVAAGDIAPDDVRDDTAQRVLNDAADQQIADIRDNRGRRWGLVSWPVAATVGAANQAMLDTITATYRQAGVQIVEVTGIGSVHPECARWERTLLDVDGPPGPHIVMVDGVRVQVAGSVAEVRVSGVFHPHCQHGLRPWWPGQERSTETYPPRTADPSVARLKALIFKWRARSAVAITKRGQQKARENVRRLREALALLDR